MAMPPIDTTPPAAPGFAPPELFSRSPGPRCRAAPVESPRPFREPPMSIDRRRLLTTFAAGAAGARLLPFAARPAFAESPAEAVRKPAPTGPLSPADFRHPD